MIKLFFLTAFLFLGSYSLRADEGLSGDQEFIQELNIIKDPFEDGIPKPVVVIQKPIVVPPKPKEHRKPPKPKEIVAPVITLPMLKLQGVIVGGDIHEAIIDDKIVPLQGAIEEAKVISVSKEGVELLYKGKKFFLKVD